MLDRERILTKLADLEGYLTELRTIAPRSFKEYLRIEKKRACERLLQILVEAQRRVERSPLSRRELIRRLGTSPAQFYRLLDQTNYQKSVDQLLSLVRILDCDVDLVIRERAA